jgi:hypothetical protein
VGPDRRMAVTVRRTHRGGNARDDLRIPTGLPVVVHGPEAEDERTQSPRRKNNSSSCPVTKTATSNPIQAAVERARGELGASATAATASGST